MITITKEGPIEYPDIRISDGEKSFIIARSFTPDLCWIPDFHPLNDTEDIIFVIHENDGEVYHLFETLYNDIITGNVFPLEKEDIQNKTEKEVKIIKEKKAEWRKEHQKIAKERELVKDGIIFWHSDDHDPFETAAVLKIEKLEKEIIITFIKNKENEDFPQSWPTYAIRICESGSLYGNFFCPFVRLHRELQKLEFSFTNETPSYQKTHKK